MPYDAADDFDLTISVVMLTVVHRIDGTILIVIVSVVIMTTVHLIKRTMPIVTICVATLIVAHMIMSK